LFSLEYHEICPAEAGLYTARAAQCASRRKDRPDKSGRYIFSYMLPGWLAP
jgi:hypothetical protein